MNPIYYRYQRPTSTTDEISAIIRGEHPLAPIDRAFLSSDDLTYLLKTQQDVSNLHIPATFTYWSLLIDYQRVEMLSRIPAELRIELLLYAMNSDTPPTVADQTRPLETPVAQWQAERHEIIALLLLKLTNEERQQWRTGPNAPLYTKYTNTLGVQKIIARERVNNYDELQLRRAARCLHIEPFTTPVADLRNQVQSLITNLRSLEQDVEHALCQQRQKYAQAPISDQNVLLVSVYQYAPYDTVSSLEDGKLYIYTAPEWKVILTKKINPWTRQPVSDNVLTTIIQRRQLFKDHNLDLVPQHTFEEMLTILLLLDEPGAAAQPEPGDSFAQLGELLADYYISEEYLRTWTTLDTYLLYNDLIEIGLGDIPIPQQPAQCCASLVHYITNNPAALPTIAMIIGDLARQPQQIRPIIFDGPQVIAMAIALLAEPIDEDE